MATQPITPVTDAEDKRKHLDFIQLVITRMNVNSFLLKGWTVTLVAGLFALAAKDANVKYIFITYISVPLFWILDGYYLSLERQYRKLYDKVRVSKQEEIDYDLNASKYNKQNCRWSVCILSMTLIFFHGTLLLATMLVMFLLM